MSIFYAHYSPKMAYLGTQHHTGIGRTQQAIAGAHKGLWKAPQRLKMAKNDQTGEKIEKLNRINDQGPLFGWFHTHLIYFGVMVHLGPMAHGPSVRHSRGSKKDKNGPKLLTMLEMKKKINQIHIQNLYFG